MRVAETQISWIKVLSLVPVRLDYESRKLVRKAYHESAGRWKADC